MINDTIKRIQSTIDATETIDEKEKKALLALIDDLKTEITNLADTHNEHAESIAGFTQVAAHESMRRAPNEELLQLGLDGLTTSVRSFEVSHPKLVNAVNSLHQFFANIGLG